MTESEISLQAKIAAHTSWAKTTNRTARTANARQAFEDKFLAEADGDPKRAESLRRAYYARLALKSAKARRRRGGDGRVRARKRPAPPKSRPSRNNTTANHFNGTATDLGIDKAVVASVDASIWQALFDGKFRLAVPCEICGRFLTASESKLARRGPRCRAKVGDPR